MGDFRRCCIALALTCAGLEPAWAAGVTQQREEGARFVGAVGCKSSSCHGGAGEKRSQYLTWSRQDFHNRAYPILLDARSARIAESLGLGEAQSSARCTVCHAPFQSVAPEKLTATARADEGVSCESCHGAASGWLRGHTRSDWTYATRVSAGMHDLRNLYVRANACVACHQNVDKDILQAGHPTLVFELDSQSVNQPKHWREDDPWNGARAWLTGQAAALREAAWHARADSDPAADAQETALALAWLLAKVTPAEPLLPQVNEPSSADLEPLQKQSDELARRAATWNPNIDSLTAMMHSLVETDSEFVVSPERSAHSTGSGPSAEALYYRARRVALALERLLAAINLNRAVPLKLEPELNALRQDVSSRGNFEPARFADHLKAFRAKL